MKSDKQFWQVYVFLILFQQQIPFYKYHFLQSEAIFLIDFCSFVRNNRHIWTTSNTSAWKVRRQRALNTIYWKLWLWTFITRDLYSICIANICFRTLFVHWHLSCVNDLTTDQFRVVFSDVTILFWMRDKRRSVTQLRRERRNVEFDLKRHTATTRGVVVWALAFIE